jgi:hypothetical protein
MRVIACYYWIAIRDNNMLTGLFNLSDNANLRCWAVST